MAKRLISKMNYDVNVTVLADSTGIVHNIAKFEFRASAIMFAKSMASEYSLSHTILVQWWLDDSIVFDIAGSNVS